MNTATGEVKSVKSSRPENRPDAGAFSVVKYVDEGITHISLRDGVHGDGNSKDFSVRIQNGQMICSTKPVGSS